MKAVLTSLLVSAVAAAFTTQEYLDFFNRELDKYSKYLRVEHSPEFGFHTVASSQKSLPLYKDQPAISIPVKYAVSACK